MGFGVGFRKVKEENRVPLRWTSWIWLRCRCPVTSCISGRPKPRRLTDTQRIHIAPAIVHFVPLCNTVQQVHSSYLIWGLLTCLKDHTAAGQEQREPASNGKDLSKFYLFPFLVFHCVFFWVSLHEHLLLAHLCLV